MSVYRIFQKSNPMNFYFGSGAKPKFRESHHKSTINLHFKSTVLVKYAIDNNLNWSDFEFEILETDIDLKLLRIKEQEWMNKYPDCLNKNKAFRTNEDIILQRQSFNKIHNPINNLKKWTCHECNKTMLNTNKYKHSHYISTQPLQSV